MTTGRINQGTRINAGDPVGRYREDTPRRVSVLSSERRSAAPVKDDGPAPVGAVASVAPRGDATLNATDRGLVLETRGAVCTS